MSSMQTLPNTRASKEFLIRCIEQEAQRQGTPLTDTERGMLYYSESAWTLPNISEIDEAFARECDPTIYERMIVQLIRKFKARARHDSPAELEDWNRAVRAINSEDHYLLVMIRAAEGEFAARLAEPYRPTRFVKLTLIGVVAGIAAILLTTAILFFANR